MPSLIGKLRNREEVLRWRFNRLGNKSAPTHLISFQSGSARYFTRLSIDANDLAFFDEQRYANGKTGFQRGLLGCSTCGCVAAKPHLRRGNRQFDKLREQKRNRSAVAQSVESGLAS